MTDQSAQEPTMEEILASIRRIISEDDAPPETPVEAAVEPAPAPEPAVEETPAPAFMDPAPSVEEPAEEDVLELTDLYEAPAAESIGDLDVTPPEPPAAPPSYDALVGESAAASAASAFAGLAASFKEPEPAPAAKGPDMNFISGSTVEGMVAEMLRPMLKDWLDANLPEIVQAQVRKEVERIARNAG